MSSFWVISDNGQRYGPADIATLQQWAGEGRIVAGTQIFCEDSGETLSASHLPELAPLLNLPMGASLSYSGPAGLGNVGHKLSEFPVWAVVLLDIFVPIFSVIWFGLMHDNLPKNRQDDPSAGKAIGFCFIPFFNIWYWNFVIYPRLVLRVNEQRMAAGLAPANIAGLAITLAVLCAMIIPVACIPLLGFVLILSIKVVSAIFFAQLQGSVNELVQATKPAGFAVQPA